MEAYNTLVRELQGRGYRVVPEPAADMPTCGAAAVALIDQQLAEAEISVHLLGKQHSGLRTRWGATDRPAAAGTGGRAGRRQDREEERDLRRFRRIIWTPRFLADQQIVGVDPAQVLCSFGDCLESDHVVSNSLVGFGQFVIQHLDANAPRPSPVTVPPGQRGEDLHHASRKQCRLCRTPRRAAHGAWPRALVPGVRWQGERAQAAAPKIPQRLRRGGPVLGECLRGLDPSERGRAQMGPAGAKATHSSAEVSWLVHRREPKDGFQRFPPRTDVDLVIDATAFSSPPPEVLRPLLHRLTEPMRGG